MRGVLIMGLLPDDWGMDPEDKPIKPRDKDDEED